MNARRRDGTEEVKSHRADCMLSEADDRAAGPVRFAQVLFSSSKSKILWSFLMRRIAQARSSSGHRMLPSVADVFGKVRTHDMTRYTEEDRMKELIHYLTYTMRCTLIHLRNSGSPCIEKICISDEVFGWIRADMG
jgi:hypothetical protein